MEVMDYLILSIIGLAMGLFGGLLGIGGSSVMIPAMMLAFGQDQHLYQAAAMLCNFFVSISAVVVHRKRGSLSWNLLGWLIPAAAAGIITGVWISNSPLFEGDNSYLLARCFGVFLVYVAIYNICKLKSTAKKSVESEQTNCAEQSKIKTSAIGLFTGLGAGLLGIGAGTISTPFQQLFLKVPIRSAISNSSAIITCVALIGGAYKTLTLAEHGTEPVEAVRIAAIIVPTAIAGGYIGGHLMHKLPVKIVRIVFIALVIFASCKMLTTKQQRPEKVFDAQATTEPSVSR